jgi:hypothetical protein
MGKGWTFTAFVAVGRVNIPVVRFVVKAVDREARNLKEHGDVHASNSIVTDRVAAMGVQIQFV